MTCQECFLQLSNNGRQWPNANWVIPWKLFWVVMFTGDEVRRAATGWGALGVQSEPQGLWSLEPLLWDVVSFSQAWEACESHLHFLVWLLKRLIAKHYVFSAGKKVKYIIKSKLHRKIYQPLHNPALSIWLLSHSLPGVFLLSFSSMASYHFFKGDFHDSQPSRYSMTFSEFLLAEGSPEHVGML